MQGFLLQSVIASIVLTVAINVLPRLFPGAAERGERRVRQAIDERELERGAGQSGPRVKVFFPWKAMLGISILLTVLVNVVGYFAN